MTAVQKIAMGLVLTLIDPLVSGYDAVPDLAGWLLILLGLWGLRDRISVSALLPLALVATLVSLTLIRPAFVEGLKESGGWLLSLPQIAFSFVLCSQLARVVADASGTRLRWLRWAFVAMVIGPVLAYAGGLDFLTVPVAVLAVAANVSLVYLLFRASPEVHGPRNRASLAHDPSEKDDT